MTRSKVIALALSGSLAYALVACGSGSDALPSAQVGAAKTAEAMAVAPGVVTEQAVPAAAEQQDTPAEPEPSPAPEPGKVEAVAPVVEPVVDAVPITDEQETAEAQQPTEPASELDRIIAQVESRYGGVDSLTARFVQTTRSSVFGAEQQGGDLKVKRPSMMRWTFEGEGGKEFVTDGKTMWIYTRADNQVLKYEDVSSVKSQADSLLQSLDRIDEIFEVTLVDDGDSAVHTLSLMPREGEAQFKKLLLVLDEEVTLKGLTMTDTFDNVTELAFSNVLLDVVVPASAFAFEVPQGAQVVDAGSL